MALCAYASVPYALNLLDQYPEFGTSLSPDICEGEVRNPCEMSTAVLYMPVTNIESIRGKLSPIPSSSQRLTLISLLGQMATLPMQRRSAKLPRAENR